MAQKKMPIDKVEETTKTVERVQLSTQKALHFLYFYADQDMNAISQKAGKGMPRNLFRWWTVPRSLISPKVKNPPVLFTRNLFEKG